MKYDANALQTAIEAVRRLDMIGKCALMADLLEGMVECGRAANMTLGAMDHAAIVNLIRLAAERLSAQIAEPAAFKEPPPEGVDLEAN